MRESAAALYRCPYSGEQLRLEVAERAEAEVISGRLVAPGGRSYEIAGGIPRLLRLEDEGLVDDELRELAFYESSAASYDAGIEWLFRSFYEDEDRLRAQLADRLDLREGSRVLEVGCGTGRDSVVIARRLGSGGELFLQDLSPRMLELAGERLTKQPPGCAVELYLGGAAHLPFADGTFDAVFHFGALSLMNDQRRVLGEMSRVARVGGRVVVGDEGLGPWLRSTEYGDVLRRAHPLYEAEPPLAMVPPEARDVRVGWLLGNAFWVLEFTVGEGTPPVDLDLAIPGRRGGTLRSRFFGQLEGVTPEVAALVARAAEQRQVSMHHWLDHALRAAAEKELAGQAPKNDAGRR